MSARLRRWGTGTAFGGLAVLALAGGGVLAVALLELIGFSPASSLVLGMAALPVLAIAYILIATVVRRWQFSMKTMLIFYVLCAFALAHFVSDRNSFRQQERAMHQLSQLQARITQDEPQAPQWLQNLVGRDHFEYGNVVGVTLVPPKTKFITDQSLKPLGDLPKLRSLELFGPMVTDAGLEVLDGLSRLEVAALLGVPVSDDGLMHVARLSRLRELYLDSTRITDAAFEHIVRMETLEVLTLDGSQVTDEGIQKLAKLTKLNEVSLNDTLVTEQGAARLREMMPQTTIRRQSVMPRSQRIAVERIQQMGGIVDRDARTNKVTTVDLAINRGAANVSNHDLAILAALSDLETLELGNNPRITDNGLAALSTLTKLKALHLSNTGVRGAGLKHLAALRELQFLNLQRAPLTDEALVHLQKLTSLTWLNLTGTPVSDAAIEKLQADLPGLKSSADSTSDSRRPD